MARSFIYPLFVLACLTLTSTGAKEVDVKRLLQQAWLKRHGISDTVTSFRYKRDAGRIPTTDLDDVIALDVDTRLQIVKTTMTAQGTRLMKMQEMFKDRVVADGVVTVETDKDGDQVLDASGALYSDIDLHLDPSNDLDRQRDLEACLRHNNDEIFRDEISRVKVEPQVLMDGAQNPYPASLVEYLLLGEGQERRPTCILNVTRGDGAPNVTVSWDALDSCRDCNAKGVGGNLNIGKIHYGLLQRCLDLRRENGVCYLENKYVRVINNNFTDEDVEAEVASYDCREMGDEVNGAYSPLLDALFYGTVVGRMYEDWYDTSPLGDPITFRVHYGVNVSNAYWNGYECQYGDGGETFYPLVSLDVVSHEIGHGVTEKNSGLYYFQQWGGINEAFSDMAGETAEAYLSEADWLIGIDISKTGKPLRYLDDPEQDNVSISHADNFTDFLDPHFGSGVYNRAFYLLVHDYNLPVRDVFHVFLHANQMYWHHMSSYTQAACDVMKAAYDLGQDGSKFRQAFSEVGVDTCDIDDHVLGLRTGQPHENITVSRHVSPFFLFGIPGEFAENVTVNASSLQSDVYIVVSNRTWGAVEDEEEDVYVYAKGLSLVQFQLPTNTSTHVSITLSSDSETPLTDVVLQASYDCVEDYTPTEEDENTYYIFFLWMEYCSEAQEDGGDGDDENGESEEVSSSEDENDEMDEDHQDASNNDDDNDVADHSESHSNKSDEVSVEVEQEADEVEEDEDLYNKMLLF